MSTFKLPLIELEDVKKMDDKEIATHLTKDDTLKQSYEAKGYKWNEPVEKLQEQGPKGIGLWKLLGSPTGGPLRAHIGLKPEVWKQMNLRISPVAGTGLNAVRTLRAEKRMGGRKSRSKKARTSRSKKTRRV
jgi:hypothetical protein